LKFTKNDEVFLDTVSGLGYTKEYSFVPIAVVDGPDKVTKFGVLLKPYCGPGAPGWDGALDEKVEAADRETLGYSPRNLAQNLLVTEEQFATRFKSLGILSQEVDLAAVVAGYEDECCDFSNREGVIRSVTKQLHRMGPGLWACEVFTLLKDYIANTPAKTQ
jgi:hypothetical protein